MKLGYSSDNRQDCTHCRFYLKDTPFQNDTAKLQLFRKPARGWRKFYYNELPLVGCFTRITVNVPRIVINCFGDIASGCRWLQQPCHACMGLCGGGHLWLRPIIVIRLSMKTRHCISRCDESSRKSEFTVIWPFIKRGRSSSRCLVKLSISNPISICLLKIGLQMASNRSSIFSDGMTTGKLNSSSFVIDPNVVPAVLRLSKRTFK